MRSYGSQPIRRSAGCGRVVPFRQPDVAKPITRADRHNDEHDTNDPSAGARRLQYLDWHKNHTPVWLADRFNPRPMTSLTVPVYFDELAEILKAYNRLRHLFPPPADARGRAASHVMIDADAAQGP